MARELHTDDLNHLANLFHIHREAMAHSGALKPIADVAMEQLRAFAEAIAEENKPEPAPAREPDDQGQEIEQPTHEEEHAA